MTSRDEGWPGAQRTGNRPIVPVMRYNARLSQHFARDPYAEGIYVIGLFFPVVAAGAARIRTQMSVRHVVEVTQPGRLPSPKGPSREGRGRNP
jgi:7-keto-8-aminopelargonate synthetase-like enzyme